MDILEQTANEFVNAKGTLFFIGVGKSQTIAKHWAELFRTIGIQAFMLDPLRMLHGDLGCVKPNDYAIFISKSGETDVLVRVFDYVQSRTTNTYAFVCDSSSYLATKCANAVIIPFCEEIYPELRVPTNSIVNYVICGNLMLSHAMTVLKITAKEIHCNHPSGTLMPDQVNADDRDPQQCLHLAPEGKL